MDLLVLAERELKVKPLPMSQFPPLVACASLPAIFVTLSLDRKIDVERCLTTETIVRLTGGRVKGGVNSQFDY